MPRAKTGTIRRARHNKVLKSNKGFRGTNSRLFKRAKEAALHAGQYAFHGRKLRKRDMRALWIVRLSAAVKQVDAKLNYSTVINKMKKANVSINRKMLSELAIKDFTAFTDVINKVR